MIRSAGRMRLEYHSTGPSSSSSKAPWPGGQRSKASGPNANPSLSPLILTLWATGGKWELRRARSNRKRRAFGERGRVWCGWNGYRGQLAFISNRMVGIFSEHVPSQDMNSVNYWREDGCCLQPPVESISCICTHFYTWPSCYQKLENYLWENGDEIVWVTVFPNY